MGTTAQKLTYLNDTKQDLKTEINRLGGSLTSESTFRSYAEELQDIYADLPKVTGEGSNISLSPTRVGGLTITPKGVCEQDSTTGKNLFDVNNVAGPYITNSNNVLTLTSGTGFNSTNNDCTLKDICPQLQAGETYILGFDTTEASNDHKNDIFLRSGGGTGYFWTKGTTHTITQAELDDRIAFYGTNNAQVSNLMIVKGSTLGEYEKYTGGIPAPNPDYPQDIRVVTGNNSVVVSNKNLFFRTLNEETEIVHVTITPNDDGSYTFNGTSQGNRNIEFGYFYPKANEYYAISGVENYTESDIRLIATSSAFPSGHILTEYNGATDVRRIRDAYTNEKTPILFQITNGSVYDNVKIYPMIEQNNAVTTFVKHEGTTTTLNLGTEYLAGIGTYKDEIVGKTDEWKIRRKVAKKQVLSTDNLQYSELYNLFFDTSFNGLYNDSIIPVCTHFIGKASVLNNEGASQLDNYSIAFRKSTADRLYFIYRDITTLPNFKTFLDNNNVFVYYVKLTETEETITDQTLITDLNNMYQAMGYDGTTNITITSGSSNAQMTASVSALKEFTQE